MALIVAKFGGTSVASPERIKNVAKRLVGMRQRGDEVVAVVSAMGKTTDELMGLASAITTAPPARELDRLLSTGEQVSMTLLAMAIEALGYKSISFTGRQAGIETNGTHNKARIVKVHNERILDALDDGAIPVVAGFQGSTEDGRITTLGRGGSDTSAVALAAALDSCECEIYTDVDGVYTTDPNLCSTARKLDRVTYEEMLEMASMGAKVLQIRSVEFAKKYNVPVHVRSTFSDDPGTLVAQEDAMMEAVLVSGIAYDKDQARVTVCGVPDRPGVSAALFAPLSENGIMVDMIIQTASREGVTDMTFTVSRKDLEKAIQLMKEIVARIGGTGVEHDPYVAKVSVIGVGMRNHTGVATKAFAALQQENINIQMISTSEIKISCLIDEKYTELAVRTLHDAFELHKPDHA